MRLSDREVGGEPAALGGAGRVKALWRHSSSGQDANQVWSEDEMQRPLEIRFRQMDPSPAIEARIGKKAAELERFSDRITGCRVTVEKAERRHRQGNLFRVRVEIDVPGKELAVTHTGPRDHAHEDVYDPRDPRRLSRRGAPTSRTMCASVAAR